MRPAGRWRHRRGRASRGMTLIEIVMAVALVALAAGIAVPSLANLSRADLRQSATMLAQKVRESYTLAALGGGTWRLVLAPGTKTVRVEETTEQVRLERGRGVSLQDDFARLLARTQAGASQDANADAAQRALLGIPVALDPSLRAADGDPNRSHGPAFAQAQVAPLTFKGSVHLLDVWTDGMDAPATDGEAYLYLFPQGYTQNAIIHLEDGDKRVFSVRVHALTGRADIEAGYKEVPK